MSRTLLAGLTPDVFLRRHWQKRPLLARQALPAARSLLTRDVLFRLAARDDVEARLVTRFRRPLAGQPRPLHPARPVAAACRATGRSSCRASTTSCRRPRHCCTQFSFIPYARLDDLMVSYAPPGGGVGPHFDSYDVFLLQLARHAALADQHAEGSRARRARAAAAPAQFPRRSASGDSLRATCSICRRGARTTASRSMIASRRRSGSAPPGAQELGARFWSSWPTISRWTAATATRGFARPLHPARIGDDLLLKSCRTLERIRWSRRTVLEFLGCHLTEPKPHVTFERPARPCWLSAFSRAGRGPRRAPGSQDPDADTAGAIFINGVGLRAAPRTAAAAAPPGRSAPPRAPGAPRRRISALALPMVPRRLY